MVQGCASEGSLVVALRGVPARSSWASLRVVAGFAIFASTRRRCFSLMRSIVSERIGKTSPLFPKRADKGRYVKSGAGEREAPRRAGLSQSTPDPHVGNPSQRFLRSAHSSCRVSATRECLEPIEEVGASLGHTLSAGGRRDQGPICPCRRVAATAKARARSGFRVQAAAAEPSGGGRGRVPGRNGRVVMFPFVRQCAG